MRNCLVFLLLLVTAVSLSACSLGAEAVDVISDSDPVAGIVFVTARHVERQTGSLGQNWELYLVQPDGTGLTRLTDNDMVDTSPSWSPDGRQIAYRSRVPGASSDIFIMNADGSNQREIISNACVGSDWAYSKMDVLQ